MNIFLLYIEFFQIGLFSLGGGLATLPFLFSMAEKYPWLTKEMVGNALAIAQSSPGAIGVNMCTQVGFYAAGVPGAFTAALGLISPSIVVILIVARMVQAFKENPIVKRVFAGLRPASAGLLAAAGFGAIKLSLWAGFSQDISWTRWFRLPECALFAALLVGIRRFKGHPVLYIALAAAAGIVFRM